MDFGDSGPAVAYKSYSFVMYQKAKDKGISSTEFSNIRERYNKEVRLRYSDCHHDWRKWCEDSKTWKHFCTLLLFIVVDREYLLHFVNG